MSIDVAVRPLPHADMHVSSTASADKADAAAAASATAPPMPTPTADGGSTTTTPTRSSPASGSSRPASSDEDPQSDSTSSAATARGQQVDAAPAPAPVLLGESRRPPPSTTPPAAPTAAPPARKAHQGSRRATAAAAATPAGSTEAKFERELVDAVTYEARVLVKLLQMSKPERRARELVIKRTRSVVRACYPSYRVELFGSWETGLALPSSDLDFVVLTNGSDVPAKAVILERIAAGLPKHALKCSTLLPSARVPVIKFNCTHTGLRGDLAVDVSTWANSVSLVQELLHEHASHHAAELIMLLKLILVLTSSNEVHKGGLSSYGLCLMVFAYVKRAKRENRRSTLGSMLIGFLEHYRQGGTFNPTTMTVDIKADDGYRSGVMTSMSHSYENKWCVQDPLNKDNNVTEQCFCMSIVSEYFNTMHDKLVALRQRAWVPDGAGTESCGVLIGVIKDLKHFVRERHILLDGHRRQEWQNTVISQHRQHQHQHQQQQQQQHHHAIAAAAAAAIQPTMTTSASAPPADGNTPPADAAAVANALPLAPLTLIHAGLMGGASGAQQPQPQPQSQPQQQQQQQKPQQNQAFPGLGPAGALVDQQGFPSPPVGTGFDTQPGSHPHLHHHHHLHHVHAQQQQQQQRIAALQAQRFGQHVKAHPQTQPQPQQQHVQQQQPQQQQQKPSTTTPDSNGATGAPTGRGQHGGKGRGGGGGNFQGQNNGSMQFPGQGRGTPYGHPATMQQLHAQAQHMMSCYQAMALGKQPALPPNGAGAAGAATGNASANGFPGMCPPPHAGGMPNTPPSAGLYPPAGTPGQQQFSPYGQYAPFAAPPQVPGPSAGPAMPPATAPTSAEAGLLSAVPQTDVVAPVTGTHPHQQQQLSQHPQQQQQQQPNGVLPRQAMQARQRPQQHSRQAGMSPAEPPQAATAPSSAAVSDASDVAPAQQQQRQQEQLPEHHQHHHQQQQPEPEPAPSPPSAAAVVGAVASEWPAASEQAPAASVAAPTYLAVDVSAGSSSGDGSGHTPASREAKATHGLALVLRKKGAKGTAQVDDGKKKKECPSAALLASMRAKKRPPQPQPQPVAAAAAAPAAAAALHLGSPTASSPAMLDECGNDSPAPPTKVLTLQQLQELDFPDEAPQLFLSQMQGASATRGGGGSGSGGEVGGECYANDGAGEGRVGGGGGGGSGGRRAVKGSGSEEGSNDSLGHPDSSNSGGGAVVALVK